MVNSVEFGKRLEKIMEEYELTASAFADRIEVGRSSISHILSGRNKPSLDFVMKVVQEFEDVEVYWLLNGKGSFPASVNSVSPPVQKVNNKTQQTPSKPDNANTTSETDSAPTTPQNFQTATSLGDKSIERIVIFYTDGTFKNFKPSRAADNSGL